MAVTNVKQSIIQKGAAEHWGENGRIPVEEVANRVNSTLEKYPVNEECSVKKYPVNEKSTLEKYPVKQNLNKPVGRTAQRIIEKNIKKLRDRGILIHEGSDKTGYWRIIVKP